MGRLEHRADARHSYPQDRSGQTCPRHHARGNDQRPRSQLVFSARQRRTEKCNRVTRGARVRANRARRGRAVCIAGQTGPIARRKPSLRRSAAADQMRQHRGDSAVPADHRCQALTMASLRRSARWNCCIDGPAQDEARRVGEREAPSKTSDFRRALRATDNDPGQRHRVGDQFSRRRRPTGQKRGGAKSSKQAMR